MDEKLITAALTDSTFAMHPIILELSLVDVTTAVCHLPKAVELIIYIISLVYVYNEVNLSTY